ncbi:MAG: NTP transferase domain-containing protein [Boseongicola sp.]|nr:MAG: NTP transferase domain-containing protein [Boseongicola sp.]
MIRTAIFPVAGKGTRMLPATRAVPKELLPVLDKPLIDFAIEEAIDAGIERLIFVTSPQKTAIHHHVISAPDHAALMTAPDLIFTEQLKPLGLGHAILVAQPHVLPGPVAVLLPDDLIVDGPGCLSEMVAAYESTSAHHLVASMTVPGEHVSRYGILDITSTNGPILPASSVIEKPASDTAPSDQAVVGRYILDPSIFDAIAAQEPDASGEIQLTDAIADQAKYGLAGFQFAGRRFDCGSKEGLLAATLHRAANDPTYSAALVSHQPQSAASAAA